MSVTVQPGVNAAADWSFSKIKPEFFASQGVKLAVRYIGGSADKQLTTAERDRLFAAGLSILLVFEANSEAPLDGGPKGATHGAQAKIQATNLGYPTDLPILVAVDTDITAATVGKAEAYVRNFAAACTPYPIGVYGDTDIVEAVKDISQLNWLPNASAWSNKNAPAQQLIHVRQRAQQAWDSNDIVKPIKAWFDGPDTLHHQEDDMATSVLPSTAVLITLPGLANTFLIGAGPPLHVDPVLFDHYRNVVGVPLVQASTHRQLITCLIHQTGVDILGDRAAPLT